MKIYKKIIIGIVLLFVLIAIIGYLLPKKKMVSQTAIIDKIYYFVMADICNHYDEAAWRSDLDTVIQKEDTDGLQTWLEEYTTGDSLLLMTIKVTENDLVRQTIATRGNERLRVVQIKDINGKTAIKVTEEIITKNPFKRIWNIFDDHSIDFANGYIKDLKEKYKNEPEDMWGS